MPRSGRGPMKKRSSHARPQATVRKKILVVEDDATSMKFLSLLLEGAGYEVFQATYSLPALFRVVRNAPDLILADLQMPIMNGLDLIRQLKGHRDTAHIPIVVVTASDDAANQKAAFEAGCVGYHTKPVDAPELLKQVAGLVK